MSIARRDSERMQSGGVWDVVWLPSRAQVANTGGSGASRDITTNARNIGVVVLLRHNPRPRCVSCYSREHGLLVSSVVLNWRLSAPAGLETVVFSVSINQSIRILTS